MALEDVARFPREAGFAPSVVWVSARSLGTQRPGCSSSRRREHLRTRASRRVRMAADRNYYSVLGLDPAKSHTADEIKRAYRRQSLKTHPDVSKAPDAQEQFLRVQEAYKVLSDPKERARFDRRGASSGTRSSSSSSAPGAGGTGFGGFDFDFGDFAKQYNTKEPVEDFGSIFSDLADQLQGKKNFDSGGTGVPGFFEEFVDFLEKQSGFAGPNTGGPSGTAGTGTNGSSSSASLDELEAELEDAQFVLDQLRARQSRLIQDLAGLKVRVGINPDDESRTAVRRLEQRTKSIETTIAKQQALVTNLLSTVAARKAGASQSSTSESQRSSPRSGTQNSNYSKPPPPQGETYGSRVERTKRDVQSELERMKKEMGL